MRPPSGLCWSTVVSFCSIKALKSYKLKPSLVTALTRFFYILILPQTWNVGSDWLRCFEELERPGTKLKLPDLDCKYIMYPGLESLACNCQRPTCKLRPTWCKMHVKLLDSGTRYIRLALSVDSMESAINVNKRIAVKIITPHTTLFAEHASGALQNISKSTNTSTKS